MVVRSGRTDGFSFLISPWRCLCAARCRVACRRPQGLTSGGRRESRSALAVHSSRSSNVASRPTVSAIPIRVNGPSDASIRRTAEQRLLRRNAGTPAQARCVCIGQRLCWTAACWPPSHKTVSIFSALILRLSTRHRPVTLDSLPQEVNCSRRRTGLLGVLRSRSCGPCRRRAHLMSRSPLLPSPRGSAGSFDHVS